MLLLPWVAEAAGLGRLTVISSLGQPLHAEIDLVSVGKDELATLSARLASPDAYKQANLQYGPALTGLRLSIEKRPNGQFYVKVTSSRPVNEPFIDLLVEINWAAGRITREYTGLIDPPGFVSAPVAPAPVAAPETRPAPALKAPAAAAIAPAERPAVAAPAATDGKEYGPIKRGETLFKIASSMKPEGVTLEQMLAGLYRKNPDAFSRNMNRMKTGKILRVPEKEELAAVTQQEAVREVRVQAADWNAYRQKLADAAGAAPESRTAARGKITTRVEDRAAGEAKDVVRLSKGEPPKGAAGAAVKAGGADRVRALEEEAIARGKALSEANERVAQLEKNLKDMQQLLALKSQAMAVAQQKAEGPAPEAAKPAPKPAPEAPKSVPEAPKPAPKPEEAAKPAAGQPEPVKPAGAAVAKPEEAKAPAPVPAAEVKPEPPKPAPKPKPKPAPPPPPEPDVMDMVMDNLPLVGGGAALLLGGLGLWMVRRRRSQAGAEPGDEAPVSAPTLGKAAASGSGAAVSKAAEATADAEPTMAAPVADEVDPLAEAEIYIAYGRDAQAEEILKEALARNPGREDVQLKLLEIYAARKDKTAFNQGADGFRKLVGGDAANWLKVAAMGYALDPGNSMYAAGKSIESAPVPAAQAPGSHLDFDLGQSTGATSTDISIDPLVAGQAQMEKTGMMEPGGMRSMAGGTKQKTGEDPMTPLMPDFTLEIPETGSPLTQTDISLEAQPADASSNIDFNIELPRDDAAPEPTVWQVSGNKASQDTGSGMDFKIDIGDINLNLDDKPQTGSAEGEGDKDAHWYDVQTKFDLAKAYQEMGDNDGAREILQEVIKEGDAEQQTEANKFLATLG